MCAHRSALNTEYKLKFRPFSDYTYVDGHFTGARDATDGGGETADRSHAAAAATAAAAPQPPWYEEVVELRRKASSYKVRERAGGGGSAAADADQCRDADWFVVAVVIPLPMSNGRVYMHTNSGLCMLPYFDSPEHFNYIYGSKSICDIVCSLLAFHC